MVKTTYNVPRRSNRSRLTMMACFCALNWPLLSIASTEDPLSLTEQRDSADLIVEARVASVQSIVLDDGYPITEYDLTVIREIAGTPTSDRPERLRLPGGVVDGALVAKGSPQLEVGTLILVAARRDRRGTLLLLSRRSLFIANATGVATDFEWNAITGVDCASGVGVALPADRAPVDLTAAAPNMVFVEEPQAHGIPWNDFANSMSLCLNRVYSEAAH